MAEIANTVFFIKIIVVFATIIIATIIVSSTINAWSEINLIINTVFIVAEKNGFL